METGRVSSFPPHVLRSSVPSGNIPSHFDWRQECISAIVGREGANASLNLVTVCTYPPSPPHLKKPRGCDLIHRGGLMNQLNSAVQFAFAQSRPTTVAGRRTVERHVVGPADRVLQGPRPQEPYGRTSAHILCYETRRTRALCDRGHGGAWARRTEVLLRHGTARASTGRLGLQPEFRLSLSSRRGPKSCS